MFTRLKPFVVMVLTFNIMLNTYCLSDIWKSAMIGSTAGIGFLYFMQHETRGKEKNRELKALRRGALFYENHLSPAANTRTQQDLLDQLNSSLRYYNNTVL